MSAKSDFLFYLYITVICLVIVLAICGGIYGTLARFGFYPGYYCAHFSTRSDTWCLVRELKHE